MATQKAPDGTVYTYDPADAVDVARVAAHCDPSYEEQRKRAAAAFAAAAPAAAKEAAQTAAVAAGISAGDIQQMIAQAVAAAIAGVQGKPAPAPLPAPVYTPVDPGPIALGATSDEATTPVTGSATPVEGSQGNA